MPTYIPHGVFKHILSFKDPTQQVGVKGGIKTDSARAMPLNWNHPTFWDVIEDPSTMYIRNEASVCHHGVGKEPFDPTHTEGHQGVFYERKLYQRQISIYYGNFEWNTIPGVFNKDEFELGKCSLPDCEGLVKPPSDLWLQCEACGPDLELYNIIRG